MRYHYHPPILGPVLNIPRKKMSIKFLILCMGIMAILFVFLIVLTFIYRTTTSCLQASYEQTAHIKALSLSYEIQDVFSEAHHEILKMADSDINIESIRKYFRDITTENKNKYREIAFQSIDSEYNFILLNTGSDIWKVPDEQAAGIKFESIFINDEKNIRQYVKIDSPLQVYYSSVPLHDFVKNMEFSVIRMTTPVFSEENIFSGYLTLSLDIQEIQRIMNLYASKDSPLYLSLQGQEWTRSFFFDASGWLICEATSITAMEKISVDNLRTGLFGDVGRPGFNTAFRPSPQYEAYWSAIYDVQTGQSGFLDSPASFLRILSGRSDIFLHYAPLSFEETSGAPPVIFGGIGYMESSPALKAAYRQLAQTMGYTLPAAVLLIFLIFFFLYRRITIPIEQLTQTLVRRVNGNLQNDIELPTLPQELSRLQQAADTLLERIREIHSEVTARQAVARDELHRQPVLLEEMMNGSCSFDLNCKAAPAILGESPAIQTLKTMIHKAAQVVADVLIIGETGTGKELTAEAIHRESSRADGPFISINCGALDENLLLDALFGHVKGAFSNAKSDRKGAFLAASGGTLLLDEIGNASAKVQQALLRALSARTIRPLGSDQSIPFDARVIAATNVDLLECAKKGEFREDLYYRLAVITIATPTLRQHKEDIPGLVHCFLLEASSFLQREPMQISHGALDKIMQYDWPGNVRELKNCITRAMIFAEGDILLARHIVLEDMGEQEYESIPLPVKNADTGEIRNPDHNSSEQPAVSSEILDSLNARQKKVWPAIAASGEISRALYQELLEEDISIRTAQYDLQDLVNKGLLKKIGRGPASRYVIAKNR